MNRRRWAMVIGVTSLTLALAAPALAQGRGGGRGGGGGGGGGGGTAAARQVSIDAGISGALKSDGLVRLSDGQLAPAGTGPVYYVDHRITHQDAGGMIVGPYADRCVGSGDGVFDLDRGSTDGDDGDFSGCNATYPGDGRTFTVVFDAAVSGDAVHDVCAQFSWLGDTNPTDDMGTGYASWQTAFAWIDGDPAKGCEVTPSAGGIITEPGSSQITANAKLIINPFATDKVKGKHQNATARSLEINFRIDRRSPGEPNAWQIKSQADNVEIETVSDDVRIVRSTTQTFDLCLSGNNGCFAFDFTMPLEVRYERFEVASQ